MEPKEILERNFSDALEFAISKGKEILRAQGHRASGKLEQSFEYAIKIAGDVWKGQILTEEYGIYVDKGVRANRVRYNPMWLIPWAKIIKPGATQQELQSFVWAVFFTHKRTGIPSPGSRRFSRNGKRTGWVDELVKKHRDQFDVILNLGEYLEAVVNASIDELVNSV